MASYTVSWGPGVFMRKHRVVRAPRWLALFVGRHLWRVLGKYHSVQIEEGVFPTSPIPTADQPVKREADCLRFDFDPPRCGVKTWKFAWGEHTMTEMRNATMSPRVERQMALGGNGPHGSLLMETTRTNYALWSQP